MADKGFETAKIAVALALGIALVSAHAAAPRRLRPRRPPARGPVLTAAFPQNSTDPRARARGLFFVQGIRRGGSAGAPAQLSAEAIRYL